jgi:hypothetical protein
MQEESQRVPFGRQVRRASAAFKAIRIGYTDEDHELLRLTTDLDVRPSGTDVIVTLRYLLRDSSGNIDDRTTETSRLWSLLTSYKAVTCLGESAQGGPAPRLSG